MEGLPNQQELEQQLIEEIARDTHFLVPTFSSLMPSEYFAFTTKTEQLSHLRALLSLQGNGLGDELFLQSDDGLKYTFITSKNYPGQLNKIVRRLPRRQPLNSASIFTAKDGSMIVDIFEMGQLPNVESSDPLILKHLPTLKLASVKNSKLSPKEFLSYCSKRYLESIDSTDLERHFIMVSSLWGSDDVKVEITPVNGEFIITIYGGNVSRRRMFEHISSYFGTLSIDIRNAALESFRQDQGTAVSLLTWRLRPSAPLDSIAFSSIQRDLSRIPYVDDITLEVFAGKDYSLIEAELLVTLCNFSHLLLCKRSPFLYNRQRILDAARRAPDLTRAILSYFIAKFSPEKLNTKGISLKISEQIENTIELEEERCIFSCLLNIVDNTLKTNFYLNSRYALGLRLNPRIAPQPEAPFGLFFVHGRGFDGIHVRFRDIARGGVRIVVPRDEEHYLKESERLLEEAYGLAFAQQLKNKDIPEGGSKAVILILPRVTAHRAGKAFTNTLLELLIPNPDIIDLGAGNEVLYLGPDENVTNELIIWIVERARHLGYQMPSAFMSSKPGAGINHKRYGVTSEGVIVFLERALAESKINPAKDEFTIKITGGPDGDVAGNAIRLLIAKYSATCRIVGIADGSGSAEDPEGLNQTELLRLVNHSLPIAEFQRQHLSQRGHVSGVSDQESIQLRNSMHNRVASDAFLPAGGRPQTINESNWSKFLLASGQPSSRVIVEGANLFITPDAREELCKRGVIIIKDSSANKCGVICSSFEIIASMLLDEQEFLNIKEVFVTEVLQKLRLLAKLEAEAIFREARFCPDLSLPQVSAEISLAINTASDSITTVLPTLAAKEELLEQVIFDYLPPVLHPYAHERLTQKVPTEYLHRVVASSLASRIVYREGCSLIKHLSGEALFAIARDYFKAEGQIKRIIKGIKETREKDSAKILQEVLEISGARGVLLSGQI